MDSMVMLCRLKLSHVQKHFHRKKAIFCSRMSHLTLTMILLEIKLKMEMTHGMVAEHIWQKKEHQTTTFR